VLGADAIFASNTSTLPITSLSEASVRPDNFIGLHFFSPVERMPLIEVILGARTSQQTLARSLDFVAQIRKTPITVNDSRGFYTSRVFQTFIHEGMAMLNEGVKPAIIENGARSAGMPIGPLALTDELALDLPLKIIRQAQAEPNNSYVAPVGEPVLEKMVAAGRSGRRAGGGFLDYPEKAKKHLWQGLTEMFPVAGTQPDLDLVRKRFLYIQAMETARCLEERVLLHAEDGDLGAVLGWGFPTWTGGTLSLIDTVGIKTFVAECETLADTYGERFRPSDWLKARAVSGEPFLPPQSLQAAA
jgi:3-hydroxyacyl-CoA dehydrogenase/enoyl-CoA hydratase/3-hydroxybutyryl-CoA epimerase